MNYYAARQRTLDKRWDYTCQNKRTGTYPVGYCHKTDWTPEKRAECHMSDAEWQRIQSNQSKYHDDGHATEQEAQACYRSYLLDNHMRLDGMHSGTQRQCVVCGNWTQKFASVNHSFHWDLCDIHRTEEKVRELMPEVHESFGSY